MLLRVRELDLGIPKRNTQGRDNNGKKEKKEMRESMSSDISDRVRYERDLRVVTPHESEVMVGTRRVNMRRK